MEPRSRCKLVENVLEHGDSSDLTSKHDESFIQQVGIDYNNAFALVARIVLIRVLTLVAQEGWHVHHMDIKSAFLNSNLKEEVYAHQPPSYAVTGEEGKVYLLGKALYDLR